MSDEQVPRLLAQLWGADEPARRGPRRGLSLEAIGGAAVEVADEHGLAGLSMKRVGERLGVSTMALYRYVDTKDDLYLLMLERASGTAPDVRRTAGWRAGLETWCRDYRTVLLRHRWMLQIPVEAPPSTPDQLGWMEAALVAMADIGLTAQEKSQVLLQVNVYVRGDVALNGSFDDQGDVSGAWARQMATLTTPAQFPEVHALLDSGELDDDDDPGEQFEFGLQRMLDGIAVLVDQRAG